ncbi:MAG TPA: polyphenol oxidase family protein [Acidimicrobiales bacterium]|nr:polyphenol oxidase family protein [Acidimicrobiales bacterium]
MPVRFTDRSHGDLAVDLDDEVLAPRRARVVDAPWTWLRQVHGAQVVVVTRPGQHAGVAADAAVTRVAGAPLAIHTADCAPVVMSAPGVVGVAHAGWRGLAAGILDRMVDTMIDLGADPAALAAAIGPCIRPRCYEFGTAELADVVAAVGPDVRSTTSWGTPALDLPAGVQAALARRGVSRVDDAGTCTACSPVHWSHRARRDASRQATVAWLEP